MSGKLDQSLDEIMKDRPATGRRGGRAGRLPARRAAAKAKTATAAAVAPAGGIKKKTGGKNVSALANGKKTVARPVARESKIAVSNLPLDVTEPMLKDFFNKTAGSVKRVMLNYGPSGRSRGSCTILFSAPDAAAKAALSDGTTVDDKPIRIEVLVGAKSIAAPAPPKSLAERMSKPKSAVSDKVKGNTKNAGKGPVKGGQGPKNKKKSGRAGKPKPKTAEQLDAEMQDYFGGGQVNGATNGAGAAANGGDTGMDEVL